VTPGPDPQVSLQVIEQERRRLGQRLEEVARLCEADVPPAVFYSEMLKRLLESLAAPAGAVWTRTPQGNLQIQYQVNVKEIGLDQSDEVRQAHSELLRLAVASGKPMDVPPRSGVGQPEEGKPSPGNTTDHLLLIVPILLNEQVAGLIEVWQQANRPAAAVPGFKQYMVLMAELAARYQRAQMLRQMTGQEQLWTQLETFARTVHGSLKPDEVAYLVANGARKLIECDRVSVAVRYGGRVGVEAVSGADVVEKRSNAVRLMRRLCDRVLKWGEKLVFNGVRDEGLPPRVLDALDAYLAESPSKLLVVMPLKDERESKSKKPPRAALVMECFETPADPQLHQARLDVVAKHATTALYNAVEHRRIPFRWVWMPVARLQEGVGGPTKAIVLACCVAVTVIISVLFLIPYPLKVESNGKVLPAARAYIYAPMPGRVVHFQVEPNETFAEGRTLAEMYDFPDLGQKILTLHQQIENLEARIRAHDPSKNVRDESPSDRATRMRDYNSDVAERAGKGEELEKLMRSVNADRAPDRAGTFSLVAPLFTNEQAQLLARRGGRREWTVLNTDFKNEFTNETVKPSDKLLWLGAKEGPWEIELKIPQKHLGHVLEAFLMRDKYGNLIKDKNGQNVSDHNKELNVEFLLRTDPSRKFLGKLKLDKIANEALSNKEDKDEAEPSVLAYVRIDNDDVDPNSPGYIPPGSVLPREMLIGATEVHAKIDCGDAAMGYSLFYGVFEFLYEKVVFFF
jgi:hypothetical protein